MRSVAVVVPWRPGCPYRERALKRVQALYAERHPGWSFHLGSHSDGPWCKARALDAAVSQTEADTLVVADADVWSDGIAGAAESGAAWAIPHLLVRRLAEDGSEEERPYPGVEGGGIVVLRRDVLDVCPPDPRFVDWGQEDESWGAALRCLYGAPWRGTADLTHFWHPPQPRLSRTRGSREGWVLRRRYLKARHDPDAMRALIGEHRDRDAAQPALHDHPQPAVG